MGLNNGPWDASVHSTDRDRDQSDNDMDEDYYTSKYSRLRHRKISHHQRCSISPNRRSKGEKENDTTISPCNNQKILKQNYAMKIRLVQTVHYSANKGKNSVCGEDSNDESPVDITKSSAGSKTQLLLHSKNKQKSRQLNRLRKIVDESSSTYLSPTTRKAKRMDNVENIRPRANFLHSKKDAVTNDCTSFSSNKGSNISMLLKTIGVKRDSHVKDRQVDTASPFVRSLDPTVFPKASTEEGSGLSCNETLRGGLGLPTCGTPRLGEADAIQPVHDNTVTHAIFEALFGHSSVVSPESICSEQRQESYTPRWDEVEDEDEDTYEDVKGPFAQLQNIPRVDEQWFSGVLRRRGNSRSDSWGSVGSRYSDEGQGLSPRSRSNSMTRSPRSRSNSMTLMSPLLAQSKVMTDMTPLLSSAAFEYALTVAGSPPEKVESPMTVVRTKVGTANDVCSPQGLSKDVTLDQQGQQPQISLLEHYITPDLITQLVLQLSSDDVRVVSPRLSVLKALYKNCLVMRSTILSSLELSAYNRALRCQENSFMAKSMSIHYDEASAAVHRRDFSGDNDYVESRPDTRLPPTAISHSGKIRDHDGSIVELALYITVAEFTLSQDQVLSENKLEIMDSIFGVVANVMRCFGSHLSSAAGNVDDSPILNGVIKIVDTILKYFKETGGCGYAVGKCVDDILERILKHWPRGDTMRELAYWRVAGAVLPYTQGSPIANEQSIDNVSQGLVSLLKLPKRSSSQRLIEKLISAISSTHFKISIEVIRIVMQREILLPVFVKSSSTLHIRRSCSDDFEDSIPRLNNGSESVPRMEALVNALRKNRKHWHAVVKASSEHALDILFEYL